MAHFFFDLGSQWILWIQGWGTWLQAPMHFFSFLGEEIFFLLLLPLIYWCYDQKMGLRIGIALLTASALNNAFKLILHTPRPYWYSARVKPLSLESSFGAPSGHSQVSAAVWSIGAYHLRKKTAWYAAILIIFFIGLSRLYLGVHFVHDVLLGWLLGGLIVWLMILVWPWAEKWLGQATVWQQSAATLALSLAYVLVNWLPWKALQGWQMPSSWQANILQWTDTLPHPVSLAGALSSAGTLFGFGLGLIWITRRGGVVLHEQNLWQKALCYLLGMLVLILLWYGLGKIFPRTETVLAFTLRYVRYTLIGFWISGLAPAVFRKLHLG